MVLIIEMTVGCSSGTKANGTVEPIDGVLFTATPAQAFGEINLPYPSPEVQPAIQQIDSMAYPEPGLQPGMGLDSHPVPTPLIIPTPSEGTGVITGLLLVGGEGGRPYVTMLYLGKTLKSSDPSYPPMIAFSEAEDPLAVEEATTGRFLFSNVTPGTYALIIWTPAGSFPIEDETGQHLLIEVQAGEVKDVGIIPIK